MSVQKSDSESLNNRFSVRHFLRIRLGEKNAVPNEVNDGRRAPIQLRQDPPYEDRRVNFAGFALLRLDSWEAN